MILGLGMCLGLWGFLGSVGTSLDEVCWVPAKKNRSTVRVPQGFEYEKNVTPQNIP